jgi:hypothetical protein
VKCTEATKVEGGRPEPLAGESESECAFFQTYFRAFDLSRRSNPGRCG